MSMQLDSQNAPGLPLAKAWFSDLLLPEDAERPASDYLVKNLHREGAETLSVIPEEYMTDAMALSRKASEQSNGRQDFSMTHDGVNYRVARMVTVRGVAWVLRRAVSEIVSLDRLGVPGPVYRRLLAKNFSKGLVLLSGEMGSGKTTTASSFVVSRLRAYGGHAVTLEDPPEILMHGRQGKGWCFQRDITGSTFARGIIEALRHASPEIIFLGELRDADSVAEALRASANGHLIVATFHAARIEDAIRRVVVMGSERLGEMAKVLLSDGLAAAAHQSLRKENGVARLHIDVLFATMTGGTSDIARAIIREGKYEQLGSEIERQRMLLRNEDRFQQESG